MQKKRLMWVDALKGFLMILVVIGHSVWRVGLPIHYIYYLVSHASLFPIKWIIF